METGGGPSANASLSGVAGRAATLSVGQRNGEYGLARRSLPALASTCDCQARTSMLPVSTPPETALAKLEACPMTGWLLARTDLRSKLIIWGPVVDRVRGCV